MTIKSAFVLAAGLGTRMRPFSDKIPKPLVPLAGQPLLDHVLDRLGAAGIETAVVNVHHHADQIERALAARKRPKVIISNERDALLETGGGAVKALPLLGPGPFLIQNSDTVWIEGVGSNIQRLISAWDPDKMDALLLLAIGALSLGYEGHGDFTMDGAGLLARRVPHREAPFVFAGVSIAHPRLFDGAPQGAFSLNVVWDRAIARQRLYGTRLEGTWMHVGTPEALREAEERLARKDAP